MQIIIKPAYDDEKNVIALFNEYTASLCDIRDDVRDYLNRQNYDRELQNLQEKYGCPEGRLLVAYTAGKAAGCIALRKLSARECEMKRLYVRPEFRRAGVADALAAQLISAAREIGYRFMLLDTLPELTAAVAFYEKLGFYRIGAYNDSPVARTIFMKLDL